MRLFQDNLLILCSVFWVLLRRLLLSLYLLDEVLDHAITIKVIGHQWYWGYEYYGFHRSLGFDSYMIPGEWGDLRLLEVDHIQVDRESCRLKGFEVIVRADDVK